MTAEEKVKWVYPDAFMDNYYPDGSCMYVIYESHDTCESKGFGRSQEDAWNDALIRIQKAKEGNRES